jgi:hypothetical protein
MSPREPRTWPRWLQWTTTVEGRLFDLFTADSSRAARIAFASLVLLVAVSSTLLFLTGAAHQHEGAWDSVFILDGAWRLSLGMRPHTDYSDVFGIVSFLPPLLGMVVAGARSESLAYGPALLLPVLAFATWNVSRRRFPVVPALGVSALIAGLTVGTFPLGYYCEGHFPLGLWDSAWRMPGYQMQYNRFQWSLLSLLALLTLVTPRATPRRRVQILEGIGAGLLAGLLLWGKPNYSVAAAILLAASALVPWSGKGRRAYWAATLLSLAASIAIYLVYVRGDVAPICRDMNLLRGSVESGERTGFLLAALSRSRWEIEVPCFILVISLQGIFAIRRTSVDRARWRSHFAAAAVLMAVGLFVLGGNTQMFDIPLWALAAVVLAEALRQSGVPDGEAEAPSETGPSEAYRLRVCLAYGGAALMVLNLCLADYGSVAYAFVWKKCKAAGVPADARFSAPSLQSMLCPPPTNDPAEVEKLRAAMLTENKRWLSQFEFAIYVNSGVKLLEGKIDGRSRVFNMDWCNPFSFALQIPPPRNGPIGWDSASTVADPPHLPLDLVFQEVTHVMVPKRPITQRAFNYTERVCGAYVREHFVKSAETDLWTLYVRKSPSQER